METMSFLEGKFLNFSTQYFKSKKYGLSTLIP